MIVVSLIFISTVLSSSNPILTDYNRVNNSNPSSVDGYKSLGIQYIQIRELDKAIKCFKQGLAVAPKDEVQPQLELLYWLGTTYCLKGDYYRAEETFRQVIASNPTSADAYFNLGAVLSKQKKYHEAVVTFKKGVELNPTDTQILFHLAGIYLIMGEYQSAIDTYTRLIELLPDDPRCYEGRASAYWKMGNNELSIVDIKRAKELHSGFRLGIAKFEKRIEKKEENEGEKPLRVFTTDPEVLYSVGEIHQSTGEFELAVETYTAAIQLNPYNPKYYEKRASAYKSLGKTNEATADLDKAKELRKR